MGSRGGHGVSAWQHKRMICPPIHRVVLQRRTLDETVPLPHRIKHIAAVHNPSVLSPALSSIDTINAEASHVKTMIRQTLGANACPGVTRLGRGQTQAQVLTPTRVVVISMPHRTNAPQSLLVRPFE